MSRAFRWPISIAAGALIVALAAQVAVPLPYSPVPLTLQGLAVLLVGGLFGGSVGAASMVLYLLAGAYGAPVFAFGGSGLARLLGPTGGYLLAFPLAAFIAGRLAARGQFLRCLFAAAIGMVAIHAAGLAQLTILLGDSARPLAMGVIPFVVQDSLKVALAALVLWRGHGVLRPRA
ncbi:MAG: biotin transporter BioY [Gemmatimonadota bacterium]|nr:biotin transporter BioY [Gemmatimonadota bacterium]